MGNPVDIDPVRRSKPSEGREVWSIFSGAMGLDLGLETADLAPTLAVEIDPTFCRTIRANRPKLDLIEGDVSKLTGAMLRERRHRLQRALEKVFFADAPAQRSRAKVGFLVLLGKARRGIAAAAQ